MHKKKTLLKISMIIPIIVFAFVILIYHPVSAEKFSDNWENISIVRIIDGVTYIVQHENRSTSKCRLAFVDTPEVESSRKKGQPKGIEAKEFIIKLVLEKNLYMKIGARTYNRNVCIISLNKTYEESLSFILVRNGYAWVYSDYIRKTKEGQEIESTLLDAEVKARASHIGIWEDKNPQPPWEFRKK